MDSIEQVRSEREDLARVLKKHKGIRRVVEDLYPDSAHFIFELLQNAEDTGATEARFELNPDGLAFEHNGRSFTHADLLAITDIGEGTKGSDDDKIGRFGVGFKAVFAYSETPHIWSPTYCFKITDLVLPNRLDTHPNLNGTTRFEFPFNNPKKDTTTAYNEVEAGLTGLSEETLLFLRKLESIQWQIAGGSNGEVLRVQHSEHHVEVRRQIDGATAFSAHFLKFDQSVIELEKQCLAIAYSLDFLPGVTRYDSSAPLNRQLRIVSARPGHVAVFFPAEKENSGLRFHLHAPFVPELSRASIKDTAQNDPLFDQLAKLAAASLHHVREAGLLTADFLSALPNPQDDIPARYDCIRTAIIAEMNSQPLTPTYSGGYAPAAQLVQGKASLKELLTDEDLDVLLEYAEDALQWAISAPQKNSNADRFLNGLALKEWDIDTFVSYLVQSLTHRYRYENGQLLQGIDQNSLEWFSGHSEEWHQRLYATLFSELSGSSEMARLGSARIVRVSDGSYKVGGSCFFSDGTNEKESVLPLVALGTYTSGRSKAQQENAKKFLAGIGVREIGEAEQVQAILRQRYTLEADVPTKKTYWSDLKRFIALVESNKAHAKLFENYYIFETIDAWRQPKDVYLDSPIVNTGLAVYYDAIGNDGARKPLADVYRSGPLAVERLAIFAQAVGAISGLEVSAVQCRANPEWSYLRYVGGDRYTSPVDRDYTIPHLKELLAQPSIPIAKLVWNTMMSSQVAVLKATYQKNQTAGYRQSDSQLVHLLRGTAWVPQGSEFVKPPEAARELLPAGFPFDAGWAWINAIQFGSESIRRTEEQRQKKAVATELGFSDLQALERARRFTALPVEQQERILDQLNRLQSSELEDQEPRNPERRRERVEEEATEAPGRVTEERARAVSVGLMKVKEAAAAYLRQQYTNPDGEMVCQICKTPLPFKLDDGRGYFERVEFLRDLVRRHYQNYIALCPNHAAMFRHANGSTDVLKERVLKLTQNELAVILAREEVTIYLTKTHIADLQAVVAADTQTVTAEEAGTLVDEWFQDILDHLAVE